MPTCARCSKNIGVIEALGFNKKTGRCGNCEKEVRQFLAAFRQQFILACKDGLLSDDDWRRLRTSLEGARVDGGEVLEYVRGDILNLLERTLTFASADGVITDEEEQRFLDLQKRLSVPPNMARPLLERLNYLKVLTRIRKGELPTDAASITLEAGEICYLEISATYKKVNKSSITPIAGRLVITSKQINFLSSSGGWAIPWSKVMRVDSEPQSVYLELSTKKGNGTYVVTDSALAQAIIDTRTRIVKRQLLVPQADTESRHIPQNVRIEVWQRDSGKCVQCGATSYLEFDHVIPFSKGGANTIGNVQLLCRGCNLKKSDRI